MQSLLLYLVALSLLGEVLGHSYLTKPSPRSTQIIGCRIGGPPEYPNNCPGPCDNNQYSPSQPHTNAQRGSVITLEWPRNNHAGGFIRIAWLEAHRTNNGDASHALFDQNVYQYMCHEVGCCADAGCGQDGGDTLGQEGRRPCRGTITVPPNLSDGNWTLQWSWFGGGGGYLGDYYSCANFRISGGPTGPRPAPVFIGGDVSNPGRTDRCEYWNTDRLHYCKREPCSDYCNAATSPIGRCGWPASNGAPFIEPQPTTTTSTTGPGTSAAPTTIAATSQAVTTQALTTRGATTQAATSQGGSTSSTSGCQRPPLEIQVSITAALPVAPGTFDVSTFIYDTAFVLGLPVEAIRGVLVKLDESNNGRTVISFTLINAVTRDCRVVDPVAAASQLKRLAETRDPRLGQTLSLGGLEIISTEASESGVASLTVNLVVIALLIKLAM